LDSCKIRYYYCRNIGADVSVYNYNFVVHQPGERGEGRENLSRNIGDNYKFFLKAK
jgi:hypothetical protein